MANDDLVPQIIVSFAIPAFKLDEQVSLSLHMTGSEEQILDSVMHLVHDCLADLSHDQRLKVELCADSTEAKLKAIRGQAFKGLEEWTRRLTEAKELNIKAENAKKQLNSMRDAYFKELQHLREQLRQQEAMHRKGVHYEWVDLQLFEPTDYCFDDMTSTILKQKVELLRQEIQAKQDRLLRQCQTKNEHLTDKLHTAHMLLERKDALLNKLMEKHGYCSELILEKEAYRKAHKKDEHDHSTPNRKDKTRKPTLSEALMNKLSKSRSFSGDAPKKESRISRLKHSIADKLHLSGEKKEDLQCINCGTKCGYHICLECGGIGEQHLEPEDDVDKIEFKPVFKQTAEQASETEIEGGLFDKALSKYFEICSEAKWQNLLLNESDSESEDDKENQKDGNQKGGQSSKRKEQKLKNRHVQTDPIEKSEEENKTEQYLQQCKRVSSHCCPAPLVSTENSASLETDDLPVEDLKILDDAPTRHMSAPARSENRTSTTASKISATVPTKIEFGAEVATPRKGSVPIMARRGSAGPLKAPPTPRRPSATRTATSEASPIVIKAQIPDEAPPTAVVPAADRCAQQMRDLVKPSATPKRGSISMGGRSASKR
mmetsp:Transcript_19575/g.33938  ORF Transcript_19575/g.33938 Transcript_19575/m.33938 type:complete len:602 (-) Transcript_19575:14-1819(-)